LLLLTEELKSINCDSTFFIRKNPIRYKYYPWNCEWNSRMKKAWHGKTL